MSTQNNLHYHSLSIPEVLIETDSNLQGLSQTQVYQKQNQFGLNQLTKKKTTPWFVRFLNQFNNPLVIILLVVIALSFALGKIMDASVILAVVLVNAAIGFWQELKGEASMNSLKSLIVPTAKVFRDNNILQIDSKELVIGDILILEEGDKIPADCRLYEVKNFSTAESSLTGESYTIPKNLQLLDSKADLGDRKNMAWSGTFVAGGSAKAIIVNTGDCTIVGNIAKAILSESNPSDFTKKIGILGQQIAVIALAFAVVNFAVAAWLGGKLEDNILFAIGSLVSGIPEGLPAILTLVLAIGANQMAVKNAIVRKLDSTETIGSINIIATDKTGTLTQNTMTVNEVVTNSETLKVSGEGWSFDGNFRYLNSGYIVQQNEIFDNPVRTKILEIATMCNKATVEHLDNGEVKVIGDPTEAGLFVLAKKADLTKVSLSTKYSIIDDFPFNSNLKMRGTVVGLNDSSKEFFVVGAAEQVLANCVSEFFISNTVEILTTSQRLYWESKIEQMSQGGVRILALAYKKFDKLEVQVEDFNNLNFVGLVALFDPIRLEVPQAIQDCQNAGIRVIMMTGDHKATALTIAKTAGIIDQDVTEVYSEQDLLDKTESELSKITETCNVFARCTPERKLQILKLLQAQGKIVAMTGDGVNDGPALKQANVGIAMGKDGTDIARESSEIILADDNFATIVKAIKQGRVMFGNIQKACNLSLCRTLAGMTTLLGATLIVSDLPFSSTQLLWLNLITETIIGIGIAFEKGEGHELGTKHYNTSILNPKITLFVILNAVVMTIITLVTYWFLHVYYPTFASTGAFLVLYFSQFWNLLNFRSLHFSAFKKGLFSNKVINIGLGVSIVLQIMAIYSPLSNFLKFNSLPIELFVILFLISILVFVSGEVYKHFFGGKLKV